MRVASTWVWWALAALWMTGCLTRAEGHCGNNGGDAACGGSTPYCELCTLANDGCVAEPPKPECRPAELEAQTSESSGSESETSGTSDSAQCMVEPGPDDDCPTDTPYCVEGTCAGCPAFDDAFCATVDARTPICDLETARCVECTPAQPQCDPSVPWCAPDLVCRGCWKHDQCPDSACNPKTGECLPATEVAWVDGNVCPETGTGTQSDPFCTIRSAVLLPTDVLTIRVRPGPPYAERVSVAAPRTIAILGEGGRPQLLSTSNVINASNGAQLILAGLDILEGNPGLNCAWAELWLEDVEVWPGSGKGMFANNCELHVHRSRIIDRNGHAIELRGRSTLDLTSSILGLNGTPATPSHAVFARDQSRFRIVYSTLAGNRSTEAASIACEEQAAGALRNAIAASFVGESVSCPSLEASHNVVDTTLEGDDNVKVSTLSTGWFVDVTTGDFHIEDVTQTPFVGLGSWQTGDPYEDVDGEPRPVWPREQAIVGADEP